MHELVMQKRNTSWSSSYLINVIARVLVMVDRIAPENVRYDHENPVSGEQVQALYDSPLRLPNLPIQ